MTPGGTATFCSFSGLLFILSPGRGSTSITCCPRQNSMALCSLLPHKLAYDSAFPLAYSSTPSLHLRLTHRSFILCWHEGYSEKQSGSWPPLAQKGSVIKRSKAKLSVNACLRQRQEDQKSKIILDYIVSSKPVWANETLS